jgi:hypothetical protein
MLTTGLNIITTALTVIMPIAGLWAIVELCKAGAGYFFTKDPNKKAAHLDHALLSIIGGAVLISSPLWIPQVKTLIGL